MPESTNISQSPTDPEEENEKSMTHAAGSDLVPFDGLTYKQYLFVNAFTGEAKGNATKAAEIAGYQVPMQEGYRLLRNADVLAQVRARAQAVMSEYETIDHLATFIRKSELDYAQEYRNKHGEIVGIRLDTNSRVKAIELMLRYHGVLTDKIEHSGTVEQQVKQMIVHVHGEVSSRQ